jgi:hypothetical protein
MDRYYKNRFAVGRAQSSTKVQAGSAGCSVPADRLCVPSDWKLRDHKRTARLETPGTRGHVSRCKHGLQAWNVALYRWAHSPDVSNSLRASTSRLQQSEHNVSFDCFTMNWLALKSKMTRCFETSEPTSPRTRRHITDGMTVPQIACGHLIPPPERYGSKNTSACEVSTFSLLWQQNGPRSSASRDTQLSPMKVSSVQWQQ